MILVDSRTGSKEFLQRLRSMGCDAELTTLDAGDFAFTGQGDPSWCASPFIGIERKTLQDLVNSMRTKRLAGQQHVRMSRIYDEAYLLVEGLWRRNRETGMLETRNGNAWQAMKGRVGYSEVDSFLCSAESIGGMKVCRTSDEYETAVCLVDRYRWWQKPWGDHQSFSTIYAPEPEVNEPHKGTKPRGMFMRREATLGEKIAAQLPGVDTKARDVAASFVSVRAMMTANEKEWMNVPGIGKIGAKRIVSEIEGERA
jgi:ERCC4-type nuclease